MASPRAKASPAGGNRPKRRSSQAPAPGARAGVWARTRMGVFAGAGALVAAVLLVYQPALGGGFLWDDLAHVTRPALRSLDGLYHIWFSIRSTQQYYPVLHTAFWLEWQLWQDSTFAYHLTNVAQHALAACLLWGVLRRLQVPGAFLAAAVFAVHPVNVESVAWITEQKNSLSIVFYLAAAWSYLVFEDSPPRTWRVPFRTVTTRSPAWYGCALALFTLGLLTKTVVATLPAALLVVAWWRRGRLEIGREVVPLLPWFALGATAGVFTAWYEQTIIGAQGAAFDLTFLQRTLLAGRVIWFYLSTLVWPSDLIFFYPRWTIDPGDWMWWIPLAGVLVVAAVLVLVSVRFGVRAPLAGFLFFAGTLFPVLGFLNVYPFRFSYVADHFQYTAGLGIIVVAAGGMMRLVQRRPALRRPVYAGAAAVVALLGWLAWKQSDLYGHDSAHHYRAIIERNPRAWVAYSNLAEELINRGQFTEAASLLERAGTIGPEFYEYYEGVLNLAVAYERVGRLPDALLNYERASRLDNDAKRGQNTYGNALLRAGRHDEAIERLRRAIDLAEQEGMPIYTFYVDLGRASVAAGRLEDGVTAIRRARELAGPDYPLPGADALAGDALVRLKRFEEATPYLRRAVESDPDDAIHRFDLGRILHNAGRYRDARPYLTGAIELRPDLVDAYIVLALSNVALGEHARARETAAAGLAAARRVLDPEAVRSVEQVLAPALGPRPPQEP